MVNQQQWMVEDPGSNRLPFFQVSFLGFVVAIVNATTEDAAKRKYSSEHPAINWRELTTRKIIHA